MYMYIMYMYIMLHSRQPCGELRQAPLCGMPVLATHGTSPARLPCAACLCLQHTAPAPPGSPVRHACACHTRHQLCQAPLCGMPVLATHGTSSARLPCAAEPRGRPYSVPLTVPLIPVPHSSPLRQSRLPHRAAARRVYHSSVYHSCTTHPSPRPPAPLCSRAARAPRLRAGLLPALGRFLLNPFPVYPVLLSTPTPYFTLSLHYPHQRSPDKGGLPL